MSEDACSRSGHIISRSGHIQGGGGGGGCDQSPDGDSYAGKWQVVDANADWQDAPSLVVSACPEDDPCCGIDQCEHGTLGLVDGINVAIGDWLNGAESIRFNRVDGATTCTCSACVDGFVGGSCQLAPEYFISGAVDSRLNGRYERLAVECEPVASTTSTMRSMSERHVYQLAGGPVLYQPDGISSWMVGLSERRIDCGWVSAETQLKSAGSYTCGAIGAHDSSPDSCPMWREMEASSFRDAPLIAVSTTACPELNPCCHVDCGDHGALSQQGTTCSCTCSGNFIGALCQLAPAYVISGDTADVLGCSANGRYERLTEECGNLPVYQMVGGRDGYMLLQFTYLNVEGGGQNSWIVRSVGNGYDPSCRSGGRGWWNTNDVCRLNPDGGACARGWQAHTIGGWQARPLLRREGGDRSVGFWDVCK